MTQENLLRMYLAIISKGDLVLYAYGHTSEVAQSNLERNLKDAKVRFISPDVLIYDLTDFKKWNFDGGVSHFQLYADNNPINPIAEKIVKFTKNSPLRVPKYT